MKLLLIRHAIAEDREAFRRHSEAPDSQRSLTDEGRKKMRKGANRLRAQVKHLDLLVASPLVRARETAGIIARAYGDLPVLERNDLSPDSGQGSLLNWLDTQPPDAVVALVGHEPDLGLLAGTLLAGEAKPLLEFRKGGVALIEFAALPVAGEGRLRWALTSGQLRSLKDG